MTHRTPNESTHRKYTYSSNSSTHVSYVARCVGVAVVLLLSTLCLSSCAPGARPTLILEESTSSSSPFELLDSLNLAPPSAAVPDLGETVKDLFVEVAPQDAIFSWSSQPKVAEVIPYIYACGLSRPQNAPQGAFCYSSTDHPDLFLLGPEDGEIWYALVVSSTQDASLAKSFAVSDILLVGSH